MLAPADKDRLLRYLDFLDSELNDFSKFSKTDWKTYNTNWKTIKGFLNSAEPLFRRLSDTIKTKVLDKCPPSLG